MIGPRFAEPLLHGVAGLPTADLGEALTALRRHEFIFEQAAFPVAEYAFKHPIAVENHARAQDEGMAGLQSLATLLLTDALVYTGRSERLLDETDRALARWTHDLPREMWISGSNPHTFFALMRGAALNWLGRLDEARAQYLDAITLAELDETPEVVKRTEFHWSGATRLYYAQALLEDGRLEDALVQARLAVSECRNCGTAHFEAEAWGVLAMALLATQGVAARDEIEQALGEVSRKIADGVARVLEPELCAWQGALSLAIGETANAMQPLRGRTRDPPRARCRRTDRATCHGCSHLNRLSLRRDDACAALRPRESAVEPRHNPAESASP